jgi:predicted GIY-YIG superfamily endonuclease
MSFWIYILRCADNSYYTGHTDNLDKRIVEHQTGEIEGYTSTRLPVTLVFAEEFPTREEALACERQIIRLESEEEGGNDARRLDRGVSFSLWKTSFDRPALSEPFILRQAQDERRVEGLRKNGESRGSARTVEVANGRDSIAHD